MSNQHRKPMADNEVLVRLVTDAVVPTTHGIRMMIDQVADRGVIHYEGRYFIFQAVEAGNPVFRETKMLDLSPPAEPTKSGFLQRIFR